MSHEDENGESAINMPKIAKKQCLQFNLFIYLQAKKLK
jgi:hypothetical protein